MRSLPLWVDADWPDVNKVGIQKMRRLLPALLVAAVAYVPSAAMAAPVTATEVLEDALAFELFDRNLDRTLSNSLGFFQNISSDAAIVTSNNVDSDFGIWNNDDVSYRHNLTWLDPAALNFTDATLTIYAYGVDNGNDVVLAETVNLGSLVDDGGGLLGEGFTTSIFSSSNDAILNLLFADGFLNITINKNANSIIGNGVDFLSVYRSDLTVTYDPVPEPATMMLLGSGLLAGAIRRRKSEA